MLTRFQALPSGPLQDPHSGSLPKGESVRELAHRLSREAGVALLLVMLLVAALALIVGELVHAARVQEITSQNLTHRHNSYYVEEATLIRGEEFLMQDLAPPPRRQGLLLTPEQILVEERQKASDSFHDFWAKEQIQQDGGLWVRTTVVDEERKFNINSLMNFKVGSPLPLQMELFERLLKVLGVKSTHTPELVAELVDYIDPDKKGKYEKNARNGPMNLIEEFLGLENVTPLLYHGYHFPIGEARLHDDEFTEGLTQPPPVSEAEEAKKPAAPFSEGKAIAAEEWEHEGIRPGLKDLLTVYGSGRINLNTAPLPLLQAILDNREAAIEVVRARKKAPFTKMEEVMLVTGAAGAMRFAPLLGFTSEYFRVEMEFSDGKTLARKFAVMHRGGGKVRTLFRGVIL